MKDIFSSYGWQLERKYVGKNWSRKEWERQTDIKVQNQRTKDTSTGTQWEREREQRYTHRYTMRERDPKMHTQVHNERERPKDTHTGTQWEGENQRYTHMYTIWDRERDKDKHTGIQWEKERETQRHMCVHVCVCVCRKKKILPNDIQYIDDILIIQPKEHNIPQIVQKLNHSKPSINFTYKHNLVGRLGFMAYQPLSVI